MGMTPIPHGSLLLNWMIKFGFLNSKYKVSEGQL